MPNQLAKETSPYLRQHAENPVDWYPWGDEAFRRAHEEDKPIHISVGYAACHWCHVMAHESFEDPQVARLMNERFINIKVDRQERPDVDDVYQKVVHMTGQGGGWPLTMFMTPQGEPFSGGTYFPPQDRLGRPGFVQVLLGLSEAWKNNRDELRQNVEQFLKGYRVLEERLLGGETPKDQDAPAEAARFFVKNTDRVHGGLGGAPKFPNSACHDLVLRIYHRGREPALLRSLELTLDRMAAGGIYDHLGGGFARYSVDERWAVPHFEKMLYDNGQLVKLLAAQDFAHRGPLEIILAGDKLGAAALVERIHRAYLPARVLAFADDVPIGEGRHPVDGQPTAYVCRNRTCDAPVTSVKALLERCAA